MGEMVALTPGAENGVNPRPIIGHVSVYADQPNTAAATLAGLIDGYTAPFGPHPGARVCFLASACTEWSDPFVEFYPRTTALLHETGRPRPKFFELDQRVPGAGSHVNIILQWTAEEIERRCHASGLLSGWRWPGLMDVWLEPDLMVELVPHAQSNDARKEEYR